MNILLSTRLVTVKSVKGKTASRLKQLCRQCLLATKNLFPWKGGGENFSQRRLTRVDDKVVSV